MVAEDSQRAVGQLEALPQTRDGTALLCLRMGNLHFGVVGYVVVRRTGHQGDLAQEEAQVVGQREGLRVRQESGYRGDLLDAGDFGKVIA